jgi:hypothetical protein
VSPGRPRGRGGDPITRSASIGNACVENHGRGHVGARNESVQTHLDGVTPEKRRRDAEKLLELMTRVTQESPQLWGSIVGFGQYHYKYQSGREGDAPAAGFAPRKAATTIYMPDGIRRYDQQLKQLGPHTTGVGCLYIKDLDKIDLSVLETIVAQSYRALTSGTYGLRAGEGGPGLPGAG